VGHHGAVGSLSPHLRGVFGIFAEVGLVDLDALQAFKRYLKRFFKLSLLFIFLQLQGNVTRYFRVIFRRVSS
jgi:hypothetical protein